MTIGIYCIEHIESGKKYIGKSKNIERRIGTHKGSLLKPSKGRGINPHLWYAVQKYGWSAFRWYIIEQLEILNHKLLAEREVYWIKHFDTLNAVVGYNLTLHSPEGVEVSEETRKRLSELGKGRKHTEETKAKMRQLQSGANHPMYGKQVSEEVMQKRAETRARNGNPNKGKKLPQEHISKVVAAKLAGRKPDGYEYHQFTKDGTLVKIWYNIWDVVGTEFLKDSVVKAATGVFKSHGGFKWCRYQTEEVQQ